MKKISCLLGIGAILLALPAQVNGQSDISGAGTTSGDIVGGYFTPTPGTVAANASPAVTAAVNAAGVGITAALTSGGLTGTAPNGLTVAIPAATQAALLSVLTGGGASAEISAALDASGSAAAGELAQALEGLLSSPATGQLAEAIGFFNAVVGDANPAFMADPPVAFIAIHAVLASLTGAAQSAQ